MKLLPLIALFIGVKGFACSDALKKFPVDCEIADRYQEVKRDLVDYNINVESLTRYRALRFFSHGWWDKIKEEAQYLIWMADTRDAPKTMMLWERGARIADTYWKDNIRIGGLTLNHLKKMNLETMHPKFMSLKSRIIKFNKPGEIREGFFKQAPGWVAKCKEWPLSYEELVHFQNYDLKTDDGDPYVWVNKRPKECKKKPGYYHVNIRYLKSRFVKDEMKKWIKNFNRRWVAIATGRSNTSPLDFIADFQREFISIHPFGDGNGRVIRMLQDHVARSFGLPFISTGHLQNDIGSTPKAYRELNEQVMLGQIAMLESCVAEYDNYYRSMPSRISGDCRPAYKSIAAESGAAKKLQYQKSLRSFFRAPADQIEDWFELNQKAHFPYIEKKK